MKFNAFLIAIKKGFPIPAPSVCFAECEHVLMFRGKYLEILRTEAVLITMTSEWARQRLKSPASRLFTQSFIQMQIKENIKAPRHWPLCGEFTGDRWIPRTNGQLRGKCFHLMTPSCLLDGAMWSRCFLVITQFLFSEMSYIGDVWDVVAYSSFTQLPCCMRYRVIIDRVITIPDCDLSVICKKIVYEIELFVVSCTTTSFYQTIHQRRKVKHYSFFFHTYFSDLTPRQEYLCNPKKPHPLYKGDRSVLT